MQTISKHFSVIKFPVVATGIHYTTNLSITRSYVINKEVMVILKCV